MKKILIIIALGLLTFSAFHIRLENYKKSSPGGSIDEVVYARMGWQIYNQGLSGYNAIPIVKVLLHEDSSRQLHKYFYQPLFKHPPFFCLLISYSMKIFGPKAIAAEYVSLLFGVLMIPLIYLLASSIFDKRVGLLAAFFLWLDPVNIICSQKIWMDTTIAFFTLLAASFFVWGLKHQKNWFFILSGLASGLAFNTKYTGILITFAIIIYSSLYHRKLFSNKKFQLSLILPFLLILPWLYWNYKVYGLSAITEHPELNTMVNKLFAFKTIIVLSLCLIFSVILQHIKSHTRNKISSGKAIFSQNTGKTIKIFIAIGFFLFIVPKQLWHGIQFTYIPTHSWGAGFFSGEPPSFYIGRLLEYSLIYIFSFIALFQYRSKEKGEIVFFRICAVLILIFFIFWGNYQSRYILSTIPFLIMLGIKLWTEMFDKVSANNNWLISWLGKIILRSILIYIIIKTFYVNIMLSYPNDFCYF